MRTYIAIATVVAALGALVAAPAALATGPTCTDTWVNTAGGAWDTGSNWSTGSAPGSKDTACITAAGSYTVVVGNESITIANLTMGDGATSDPTLQIGNGNSSFPDITVSGTVTNNAGSTISDGWGGTFTAGSMTNAGTFLVPSTGYTSTFTFGNTTNSGSFEIEGASNVTVSSGDTFENTSGATIANGATTAWSGGTLQLDSGGAVDNTGSLSVAGTTQVNGGSICGNALDIGSGDGAGGSPNATLSFATTPGTGPACGTGQATDQVFIYNVHAVLSGTIPSAYTVTAGDGGSSYNYTNLSGSVVNDGTFVPGWGATITSPTTSDTLTNNGTLTVPVSGYTTALNLTLVNDGSVAIDANTTGTVPSSTSWTNSSTGSITVAKSVSLSLSGDLYPGAALVQDGLITNSGTLSVAGGTQVNGGTVCGDSLNVGSGDGGGGSPNATLSFASKLGKGPVCAKGVKKNQYFIYNVTAVIYGNIPLGYTVTIGDGGASYAHVSTPGSLTNSGTLVPTYGATLTVNGTLTNDGTLEATEQGYTTTVTATSTTNAGTISVPHATLLVLNGPLTNYNATTSTLTGGTYLLSGTLQYTDSGFTGTGIEVDAASITITGSGEFEDANGANGLRNFATIASGGLFGLGKGTTYSVPASLTNSGTVSILAGDTLKVPGNYTQNSSATWSEGINSQTKYGIMKVTGTSTLGGTLALGVLAGWTSKVGEVLTPLTAGTNTGTFASVTGTATGNGNVLVINYTATGFTLTVQSGGGTT